MMSPVDSLRSRRRSSRYSCPRPRASVTRTTAPNACSYASNPSSTQIVVWNDERHDAAVDTRLDFPLEERRVAELRSPGDVAANAIDRDSRARARRIEAEI